MTVWSDSGGAGNEVLERRTGLLIIRVWFEDGSAQPLRAQLRTSSDVTVGFERTVTLARPDAVCAAVREWLDEVMANAELAD